MDDITHKNLDMHTCQISRGMHIHIARAGSPTHNTIHPPTHPPTHPTSTGSPSALRTHTRENHVLSERCAHEVLNPGADARHVVAVLEQAPRQLQQCNIQGHTRSHTRQFLSPDSCQRRLLPVTAPSGSAQAAPSVFPWPHDTWQCSSATQLPPPLHRHGCHG